MVTLEKTEISLDKYAGRAEAAVARRLVRKALEAGYKISVHDGGEWTVKGSTDRNAILEALATTGEDTIRLRDADNNKIGSFSLVYQDGPGDELIADFTDNEIMEGLYKLAIKEG